MRKRDAEYYANTQEELEVFKKIRGRRDAEIQFLVFELKATLDSMRDYLTDDGYSAPYKEGCVMKDLSFVDDSLDAITRLLTTQKGACGSGNSRKRM